MIFIPDIAVLAALIFTLQTSVTGYRIPARTRRADTAGRSGATPQRTQ